MTLLWTEGFESVAANAATGLPKGTTGAVGTVNTSYGRYGGTGYQIGNGGTNWAIFGPQTTLIVGLGVRFAAYPAVNANAMLMSFYNVTTASRLSVTVNGRGGLDLRLGAGDGTVIASSVDNLTQLNVYGYLEMKATMADSGGTAIVRWNGVEVINFTGDTRSAGTGTTWDTLLTYGINMTLWLDDLYIANADGPAPNNDFLGDVRVVTIYPNGNGNSSQGTGSDANSTDNYLLVDEAGAVTTADYVDLSAAEKDTYTYQDISGFAAGITVYGVHVVSSVAKTDAGAISGAHVARYSSTESTATAKAMPATVGIISDIFETKPTGGAWSSLAEINGTEFGLVAS